MVTCIYVCYLRLGVIRWVSGRLLFDENIQWSLLMTPTHYARGGVHERDNVDDHYHTKERTDTCSYV